MKGIKFDLETGKQISKVDTPIVPTMPDGYFFKETPDGENYYFDFGKGEPVKCEEMPVTINGTNVEVPKGTEFRIKQPFLLGNDGGEGLLEFNFPDPGQYEGVLYHIKYNTKEIVINAS